MVKLSFVLILLSFFCLSASAAETPYYVTHFNSSNGLPGNTVYHIFQDSKGYIWMCTENGLVCYNGYSFKTYTIADGLPDNEIFNITEDRQGRLWIIPFASEVCYIRQGRIYNRHNDSLLARLKLKFLPIQIIFDKWGNVWINEVNEMVCISASGKLLRFENTQPDDVNRYWILSSDNAGNIYALFDNHIYTHDGRQFKLKFKLPAPWSIKSPSMLGTPLIMSFAWMPYQRFIVQINSGHFLYCSFKDVEKVLFIGQIAPEKIGLGLTNGFYIKDAATGKTLDSFLSGLRVSGFRYGRDSSIWLSTLGNGVYHFTRSFIRSVPLSPQAADTKFISMKGDTLIAASESNMLTLVKYDTAPKIISEQLINAEKKSLTCLYASRNSKGDWLVCNPDGISKYTRFGKLPVAVLKVGAFKGIFDESNDTSVVATSFMLFRFSKLSMHGIDTLSYMQRFTSVSKIKNIIYAGSMTGILRWDSGSRKMVPYLSNIPLLNVHIIALCADSDSTLWVANNQAMIFGIRNDRIVAVIDKGKGLACNNVRLLKISDSLLWIGTDDGVYAFSKKYPFNIINHFSDQNGLNSNDIKSVALGSGCVWVATNKGINYFRERDVLVRRNDPSFFITSIHDGQKQLLYNDQVTVAGDKLDITFDAIDPSGIKPPQFSYRFNNNAWAEIGAAALHFPALPYGHFSVVIKASSPDWPTPKELLLNFYRPYPFYLQWRFILLAVVLLLSATVYSTKLVLSIINRKKKARLVIQQNLLQLEQLALQGQMNAHFIFNCLTAIRQHYNNGNTETANRFVDAFADLTRTAFEMVNHTFTTLDKELRYLQQYLTVEQERFGGTFDFLIHLDIQDAPSDIPVPAMILQPFVEMRCGTVCIICLVINGEGSKLK